MAKRSSTPSPRSPGRKPSRPPRTPAALDKLSDARLLALRFKDLPISIERSPIAERVEQLHDELARADIRLRPHAWLSDEWFTPRGVPGIAVPFYLAHPRLTRLERSMMLEAEGESHAACMRILRHEAGHCVQYAFRLNRRKRWRELFGLSSTPYPESYLPKPFSRDYVQHLDNYYAQAHPEEDFAETFAVWLTPTINWRKRYADWPAIEKLEYVDEVMAELAGEVAPVKSRRKPEGIASNANTLRVHYEQRRAAVSIDEPDMYARDLMRLFPPPPEGDATRRTTSRAGVFLRRNRRELVRTVARYTGHYQYAIDSVADEMIARCAQLKLRLPPDRDEHQLRVEAAALLTVIAMNEIHGGGLRVSI